MTLREEVLKISGLSEEDHSKDPKWVSHFREIFDELYEKALEKSGMGFNDFAGSDKYREWVDKEIKPLLKGQSSRKVFEKWERDLLFDID